MPNRRQDNTISLENTLLRQGTSYDKAVISIPQTNNNVVVLLNNRVIHYYYSRVQLHFY